MFEHGIYTLLDGHQDLLGPDLCGRGFQVGDAQNVRV